MTSEIVRLQKKLDTIPLKVSEYFAFWVNSSPFNPDTNPPTYHLQTTSEYSVPCGEMVCMREPHM